MESPSRQRRDWTCGGACGAGWLAGQYPLLREVASYAAVGSGRWCRAQALAGWAALFSGDVAGALDLCTALRDAAGPGPSRALADALAGRSAALWGLGRLTEAAEDGRRGLAIARELGYPLGEVLALGHLAFTAAAGGDLGEAVRLARQADQFPGDIPASIARGAAVP